MSRLARLTARMDQLYEYDREPVRENALEPGRHFAGLFAGEHVAATEFVIGAFFVLHGVAFRDLLLGLLFGNLLAVLSWTFVCAPIAVRTRLTLYWYPRHWRTGLMAVYNVPTASYCILPAP
jgi:purine-cytosine permease-like protein